MKEQIKALILEGKSDEQIAEAILAGETKATAKEIAKEIETARKSEEVTAELKAMAKVKADEEAKKAQDDSVKAQVKAGVDEALKSVKTAGFFVSGDEKTKLEKSEAYKTFGEMLGSASRKDSARAMSISKEIDQENDRIAKLEGKATPTVSDSTTRGGYSVPTLVDNAITDLVYAQSVMLQNAYTDVVIVENKVYPVMYGVTVSDIADQSTANTESNPTFDNPSIAMKRFGAFSAISNTILQEKGADLVNAFMRGYASSVAEYLDLRLAVGNVTNSSDLFDGLVFDANTVLPTEIALADLGLDDLRSLEQSINYKTSNLCWIANRKVCNTIASLENSAGNLLFPQYLSGGEVSPLGIKMIKNPLIPSTLDVSADKRTTGTDDVLILADMSKFVVGLDGGTRIDMSSDFLFTSDAMVIRAVRRVGCKVLMSNTSASGGVALALALTN